MLLVWAKEAMTAPRRVGEIECPKCGEIGEEISEEVDIGVGVQKHLIGMECKKCGQIAVCNSCGQWDGSPHYTWCLPSTPRINLRREGE